MSKRVNRVVLTRADKLPLSGNRAPGSGERCPRCQALLSRGWDSEPACWVCGYHDWLRMPGRYAADGELETVREW